MRRYIISKWAKTLALVTHPIVSKYVPKTMLMNKENVGQMLHQFRMVYVKPDSGTFGQGVMKIEWNPERKKESYSYQIGTRKRNFNHFDGLYVAILQETKNKKYVVQKGIHLLKHKGSPSDLRVMVQKTPQKKWETTGVMGRVANPQKIVTNFHNGGTLKSIDVLLKKKLTIDKRKAYVAKLRILGCSIAKALTEKYPGIREIGIDVGVDPQLKPWILEVNTSPDPFIFKSLPNPSIFQKIMRYRKYNRKK